MKYLTKENGQPKTDNWQEDQKRLEVFPQA